MYLKRSPAAHSACKPYNLLTAHEKGAESSINLESDVMGLEMKKINY